MSVLGTWQVDSTFDKLVKTPASRTVIALKEFLVYLRDEYVSSQDIRRIVKTTQTQYDALAVKDPSTLYVIEN